jgi:hypothetical protein
MEMERDESYDGKRKVLLCEILYYKLNNMQGSKLSVIARNNSKTVESLSYKRIIFLRCLSSPAGFNVFVILLGKNRNSSIFDADLDGRDIGNFQPGSIILLPKPSGITNWMSGHNLPIIDVPNCIFCVSRSSFSDQEKVSVPVDSTSLRIQAFSYAHALLEVISFHVIPTCCTGGLCGALDSSPAGGVALSKCPCFHTLKREGNFVFLVTLKVTIGDESFIVRNFSNKRFTNFFLKGGIPPGVTAAKILSLNIDDDLMDAVEGSIEAANSKGGFSLSGWLRRGLFNDEGDVAHKDKIVSGEKTHHLISIDFNDDSCVDNYLVDLYVKMNE